MKNNLNKQIGESSSNKEVSPNLEQLNQERVKGIESTEVFGMTFIYIFKSNEIY